jgi:hypothetical protein
MGLSVWRFLRGDDEEAPRAPASVQSAGAEPATPLGSAT